MDCLFCKLLKESEDQTLICKFKHGSVYLNKNQFFYGRILYVLANHWTDISDMPENIFEETSRDLHLLTKIIKIAMQADLINVASLGNYVPHIHWHIIPRYKNDPCWGSPPWPHGETILPKTEFQKLKIRIREAIEA